MSFFLVVSAVCFVILAGLVLYGYRDLSQTIYKETFRRTTWTKAAQAAAVVLSIPALEAAFKGFEPLHAPVLGLGEGRLAALGLGSVLFMLVVPLIAYVEERIFRHNRLTWPMIALFSVLFGLLHVFNGYSFVKVMAVTAAGFALGVLYRTSVIAQVGEPLVEAGGRLEEAKTNALFEVTTYHTLYNLLAIPLAYAYLVLPSLA